MYIRSKKGVYYSECDTCELISSSTQNLSHLFDNISRTMRCAEETLIDGNTIIICPKSNQKWKSVCLIQNKAENDTPNPIDIVNCDIEDTDLKTHISSYCNYVHRDWNLTVGESIGTLTAKIKRDGDKFTMQYRYYFKDIYEWAYHYEINHESVSTPLHAAHEVGLAQEYLMQGYFEGYLTWNLNEKVIDKTVAQQIFMTLADKEGGLGSNQSYTWTKSNEIERFKESLSMEW